jgi:hypothetical protein
MSTPARRFHRVAPGRRAPRDSQSVRARSGLTRGWSGARPSRPGGIGLLPSGARDELQGGKRRRGVAALGAQQAGGAAIRSTGRCQEREGRTRQRCHTCSDSVKPRSQRPPQIAAAIAEVPDAADVVLRLEELARPPIHLEGDVVVALDRQLCRRLDFGPAHELDQCGLSLVGVAERRGCSTMTNSAGGCFCHHSNLVHRHSWRRSSPLRLLPGNATTRGGQHEWLVVVHPCRTRPLGTRMRKSAPA